MSYCNFQFNASFAKQKLLLLFLIWWLQTFEWLVYIIQLIFIHISG